MISHRLLPQAPRLKALLHCPCQRALSSCPSLALSHSLEISDEVADALATRKPVVALESAIYTHGFPFPENSELARQTEDTVRANGAVPATICVLNGIARVGLSPSQLEQLAASAGKPNTTKVSRRDLPFVTGMTLSNPKSKYVGGTTIAGTMVLAHLAGIKIFATGGLGGVHRGAEHTMDISADLTELGRTNVAVISSGPKAFLDLEKTLEYLETQGVYVGTFGKRNAQPSVELPAFYSVSSGVPSPSVVESPQEAASIVYSAHAMGLTSGQFFANPIPKADEIPYGEIQDIISAAIIEAEKNVKGKDITPYILGNIKKRTEGRSIRSNRALVLNNAKMGANVAVELVKLEGYTPSGSHSLLYLNAPQKQDIQAPNPKSVVETRKASLIVIGGLSIDIACKLLPSLASPSTPTLYTSNPSRIIETLGGVAANVAYAAHLSGVRTHLVSSVGSDVSGKWALAQLSARDLSTSGVYISTVHATSRYIALNDVHGGLHIAAADFGGIEQLPLSHITSQITESAAEWVCIDGNLAAKTIAKVLAHCRKEGKKVFFEPTSTAKARNVFATPQDIEAWPNPSVYAAAPNSLEVDAMWQRANDLGFLSTDNEAWWLIIDALGLNARFRDDLALLSRRSGTDLLAAGTLQKALQLLPFIPNLFIKLGKYGAIAMRLLLPGDRALSLSSRSSNAIVSRARDGTGVGGLWVEHFKAEFVDREDVVSVNGAGDTFLGVLLARLAKGGDLTECVRTAQRAAARTIRCSESVSIEIKEMFQSPE